MASKRFTKIHALVDRSKSYEPKVALYEGMRYLQRRSR